MPNELIFYITEFSALKEHSFYSFEDPSSEKFKLFGYFFDQRSNTLADFESEQMVAI